MKKIISTITCLTLFSSISFAAIPEQSFIVDDKAYSNEYLSTDEGVGALSEIIDVFGNDIVGDVFFKLDINTIYDVENGKEVSKDILPQITYYDANGNKSIYEKDDGNKITDGFYIEDIK